MEPWRGRRRTQRRRWASKSSRGKSVSLRLCADLPHVDEELNLETDPHHRKKLDPDPHQSEKSDPDSQQRDADLLFRTWCCRKYSVKFVDALNFPYFLYILYAHIITALRNRVLLSPYRKAFEQVRTYGTVPYGTNLRIMLNPDPIRICAIYFFLNTKKDDLMRLRICFSKLCGFGSATLEYRYAV